MNPHKQSLQVRLWIVVVLLVLAAMACSLSTSESDDTDPTPLIVTTPTAAPTLTPFVSPTPQTQLSPTPTGQALPDSGQAPATLTNCTPQTTWPLYTVVAGDTLGRIAERSETTVATLVTANCLSNPELIYIGQQLYVPVVPAAPTQTPIIITVPPPTDTLVPTVDADQPVYASSLAVEPFWTDSGLTSVTYSDIVRINAGEVYNADRVVFYVDDPSGGPDIFVGEDVNPWDGAFIDYPFPAPGTYTFHSVAQNDVMSVRGTSFTVRYDPGFVPPGGQRNLLSISPAAFADGWYQLTVGSTVTISWPDAPVGAERVDFVVIPTGTGLGDTGDVIGSDLDATDGALITWSPAVSLSAHLEARATMPGGSIQRSEIANIQVQ